MDAEERRHIAHRLYGRRAEAVMVAPAEVSIGEWRPSENECHANVAEWCAHEPGYTPVRGWLYLDLLGRFIAHSVVRSPSGELFDITPAPKASRRYPFIIAEEAEADYVALITENSLVHVDLYL